MLASGHADAQRDDQGGEDRAAHGGVGGQRGADVVAEHGDDDAEREAGQATAGGGVGHQRHDGAGGDAEHGDGVELEVEPAAHQDSEEGCCDEQQPCEQEFYA